MRADNEWQCPQFSLKQMFCSLKLDLNPISVSHDLIGRGWEFHTVGPALAKDLSPYVLSLVFATVKRNWSGDLADNAPTVFIDTRGPGCEGIYKHFYKHSVC